MALIEALLRLPEDGQPTLVGREVAAELATASARFVQGGVGLWSLTEAGRRFLVQFRPEVSVEVSHIVVKLVREAEGPVFHLLCDERLLLKVQRSDLLRTLQEIKS